MVKMVRFLCVFVLVSYMSSIAVAAAKPYRVERVAPRSQRIRGIYINSATAQSRKRLQYLVKQSRAVGVNTFVMDYVRSPRYRRNVRWVEQQGMQYIPRIVMYAGGGTHAQLTSKALLEKRMAKINATIDLGAREVQLDYIRYNTRNPASVKNTHVVAGILRTIQRRLHHRNVRLQIDVFGIAAHRPSLSIGQDIKLMGKYVDAVCPMVYPSHYKPYDVHSRNPYQTIRKSLTALVKQMHRLDHVDVYPYIEAYNFRYKKTRAQRIAYIREQLRAAKDSHADGWMVWSAKNSYNNLFAALR